MKKIISTLFVCIITISVIYAQAPSIFKYQAVVRDNSGAIIASQLVKFRISLLKGSPSGTTSYMEQHTTATNQFGIANLEIGNGSSQVGAIDTIQWGKADYFIKIELDPTGSSGYQFMGTSQLFSVPYALYAGSTGSSGTNSSLPAGAIVMYSGAWNFDGTGLGTGTLLGWALCNGNNGTSNLTDRFIMAATASSQVGITGGTSSYSLTTSQLPSHTHAFTTNIAGVHTHTYSRSSPSINIAMSTGTNPFYDDWTNTQTDDAGDHSHSGTTNASGSGASIDNRPAFFKLAFIMKL